jgi:hypothetical protein
MSRKCPLHLIFISLDAARAGGCYTFRPATASAEPSTLNIQLSPLHHGLPGKAGNLNSQLD